jgi:hypothetical protein
MNPSRRASTSALSVILACTGCSSSPEPAPVPGAAQYDRAFDAALGAAHDIGVEVLTADRAAGRILGTRAGGEVKISLQWQPGGSTKVEFSAPGSVETQPRLSELWLAAYNRRMGR